MVAVMVADVHGKCSAWNTIQNSHICKKNQVLSIGFTKNNPIKCDQEFDSTSLPVDPLRITYADAKQVNL